MDRDHRLIDAIAKFFEIRSQRHALVRTAWLTALITIVAACVAHAFLSTFYPADHAEMVAKHIAATIGITLILAGPLLAGFNQMALKLFEANRNLAALANRDQLTGLLNRRAFAEEHALLVRKAKRRTAKPLDGQGTDGWLMVLDADHFKRINDEHGHDVGDAVLRHLATVIVATTGPEAICARLGGEEFGIIGLDAKKGPALAETLRRRIADVPFAHEGARVAVKASIGFSRMSWSEPLSDALRRADSALYAAKNSGRNRVVVVAPAAAPAERELGLQPAVSLSMNEGASS
jgi:diguanylate cyclase (GGDEF)-like protein